MSETKNKYLPNGHNFQAQVYRFIYQATAAFSMQWR